MEKLNNTSEKINFCVIEDDQIFREVFSSILRKHGDVEAIGTYQHATQYLKTNRPDMIFIDINLHGLQDGPKLIKLAAKSDIHCVVVSGHDDEELISHCIDLGAKDYYVKGDEVSLVKDIISKFKTSRKPPTKSGFTFTSNALFKKNLEFVLNNAASDFPILLQGETGSGKTFFAKQIHLKSGVQGKFIAVNCSTIPQEIFESEMFGHEKGSFSGAQKSFNGKILEAHNGTLYLDEIDSMPLAQQAKLLKVIEDKEFYPVGSNSIKKSNFRLITSSQKNMHELIQKGTFREDLYYRISFINLRIMPLRERPEDIMPLLKQILKGPRRYRFTPKFVSAIESYKWSGNIRELNILAAKILLSQESLVSEDIVGFTKDKQISASETLPLLGDIHKEKFEQLGLDGFLEAMRYELLTYTLEKNSNNVKKAIKDLGCSSASFYRWRDCGREVFT